MQKSEHDDLTISGTNGKCKQSMFWRCKKVAFSCGEEDVRAKKNVLMNLISKHWTLMLAHFSFINNICVTKLCKINMLGWTLFFESSSARFEFLFCMLAMLFVCFTFHSHATYHPNHIHSISHIFLSFSGVAVKTDLLEERCFKFQQKQQGEKNEIHFLSQCCMS